MMGQTIRKMVLVPEALLDSTLRTHEQLSNPTVERVVELDREMEQILSSRSLKVDEKAQQYSEALRKYMHFKGNQRRDEESKPTQIVLSEAPPTTSVVTKLPKTFQARATRILDELHKIGGGVDIPSQQLVTDGVPVKSTDMHDILHHHLNKKKQSTEPLGYPEFAASLAQTQLPLTLRRARLTHSKRSPKKVKSDKSDDSSDMASAWETVN